MNWTVNDLHIILVGVLCEKQIPSSQSVKAPQPSNQTKSDLATQKNSFHYVKNVSNGLKEALIFSTRTTKTLLCPIFAN